MGLLDLAGILHILNLVWILFSALLLAYASMQILKKSTRNVDKRRNSALATIFGSTPVILNFLKLPIVIYWLAPVLAAVSLGFFVLFLEISKNNLDGKRIGEFDILAATTCALLFLCSQLVVETVVFQIMYGGAKASIPLLLHTIIGVSVCATAIFVPKILDQRRSRTHVWKNLHIIEKKKIALVEELLALLSVSLGLGGSALVDKIIPVIALLSIWKVRFPKKSSRVTIYDDLSISFEEFVTKQRSVKTSIWRDFTNVEDFPSGIIYSFLFAAGFIPVALNYRFFDPLQISHVTILVLYLLPIVFSFYSSKYHLLEKKAIPCLVSLVMPSLFLVTVFPAYMPVHIAFAESGLAIELVDLGVRTLNLLIIILPLCVVYPHKKMMLARFQKDLRSYIKWSKIDLMSLCVVAALVLIGFGVGLANVEEYAQYAPYSIRIQIVAIGIMTILLVTGTVAMFTHRSRVRTVQEQFLQDQAD